jgi:hypothetical protein
MPLSFNGNTNKIIWASAFSVSQAAIPNKLIYF